jgi:hypothetical protein
MKKILSLITVLITLSGCSNMKPVDVRTSYAEPKWYANCLQTGKEGVLWWSKDMVYSCGAGESRYAQAAEEQMYAIALNNFAKRINSRVNSETEIKFIDDKKSTKTVISYKVNDTVIREHVQKETGHFTMGGKHYTFVQLKMPKNVFDQLTAEARQQ